MDVGEILLGVGRFVLATTLLLLLTVPTAFIVIQMEMKIIAQMQLRFGPNRIGPWGIFQSTIHGFKVLAKEDTTPDQADRPTFTMAPWMVFMAAAMSMLVIPWAPGLVAVESSISVVYFFAVLGLSVVGLLVAGWASYNKYSLLGGLRSAAQMVSYEIPLTLSVVGLVVLTGSLSFTEMIEWQRVNGWGIVWQFWAFPIFFIAAIAEINRTPFDMVEADSEIVAGFATEYSGMRFGFFFFAEYVALFIMSAIVVTLFFGGWLIPFVELPDGILGTVLGLLAFFIKTYFFVFVAVWMRTTLPRVRVDQLMGMAWKWLLPLALVNLFVTAAIVLIFNLQPVGGA
ncbi:MAG TPA: NADH-quinone oxidoreductase subunit NuoH [Candidatus Limnocylindria bacterium]